MFIMVKTNLKTLAYNTIKQKIVTCEYAPGTFLNEEILTDELKISRKSQRLTDMEALKQAGAGGPY
jgi:DNA-binding GntR family transcriptional regulator